MVMETVSSAYILFWHTLLLTRHFLTRALIILNTYNQTTIDNGDTVVINRYSQSDQVNQLQDNPVDVESSILSEVAN
jgi:hypothetical protein